MFDTIAAISTGNINQPISIIKISGSNSFAIMKKIFNGKIGKDKNITYGNIVEGKEIIDEVLISWFKSPNTFTGEDIVEIQAHGGVVNTQKILRIVLNNGARLAIRGEFTRRAFLNKKINLLKAEAIHDLIFAKTEEQAKISIKKFDGKTTKLINEIVNKLLLIIGIIETNIDYPEYDDIEVLNRDTIIPKLNDILNELNEIKKFSVSSKYIFEGINVCIVGKPNVGKSTLLNAILGENKAIVTNEPGTTRDIVEANIQIGQIMFHFSDTAGIRKSHHKIEILGIKRTFEQIEKSNLVLHIIDASQEEDKNDKLIENKSYGKIYIKIYNKSDLKKHIGVTSSAINGDISEVIDVIQSKFKNINLNNEKIITNTRQLSLIDKSIVNIEKAIFEIKNGLEPDEVIIDIRNSWKNIGSIIGKSSDEDMLDEMFKNFCLGK